MKIACLDFEASGLGVDLDDFSWTRGSFPIEVGITVLDTGTGSLDTWSAMIRPHPSWDLSAWDPKAEAVHGLTRDVLAARGADAADAAREALARLAGCDIVMAGHAMMDGRWATMLFKASGLGRGPEMKSFEDLVTEKVITMDQYCAIPDRRPDPAHRAGEDSRELAEAVATVLSLSADGLRM